MKVKPRYDGPALLHVGYPKTASTYLQETIFSNRAFGMELAGGKESRSYLIKWFRTDDQYLFNPLSIVQSMERLEEPIRLRGVVPVWSEETLLGNPFTRHYDGAWTLSKLRSLRKPFKTLITIRKQNDFCLSAYREHLKFHRHSLRDFIGTGSEARSYQSILHWEYLCFDIAVRRYRDAFGPRNVVVLPQELLNSNPDGFLEQLTSFVDIPKVPSAPTHRRNVGLGGSALVSARYLNALFVRSPLGQNMSFFEKLSRRLQRFIHRSSPRELDAYIEGKWRAQIEDRYGSIYQESNDRLQSMIDVDLAQFGYRLSGGGGCE